MLVGVISDTHIPRRAKAIPPAVARALAGTALILHAGDLTDPAVLAWLRDLAPVEAVAGNGDPPELAISLGRQKLLTVEGFRIGLIHGDGRRGTTRERAAAAFPGADCIVYGHSHLPNNTRSGATLLFNPGSPTDRRRSPACSYGLLHIDEEGIRGEFLYI